MPQLDNFSFFSQTFWVLLFFVISYFLNLYYILPGIATVLKLRRRVLSSVKDSCSNDVSVINSSGDDFLVLSKLLVPEIKQPLVLKHTSLVQKVSLAELKKIIPNSLIYRSVHYFLRTK